tara:strand:- start:8261 stop:8623 length:363 start_codon:yes stop_codon:yes gene_type:complete
MQLELQTAKKSTTPQNLADVSKGVALLISIRMHRLLNVRIYLEKTLNIVHVTNPNLHVTQVRIVQNKSAIFMVIVKMCKASFEIRTRVYVDAKYVPKGFTVMMTHARHIQCAQTRQAWYM